jgi:arylsulfatase A-like enzyme
MMRPVHAERRKSNLIVFLPDQQRADTMSCYGNKKIHSPNLAKLASESVIFQRAYVTHPVCTPSRSSLMTGMWPHTTGCTKNSVPLSAQFKVLPELLCDKNYRTGYIGKWHLGDEAQAQRGFEEWVSTEEISDYSNFLIDAGLTPDKPDSSFSAAAISELPLELSKPRFLEKHALQFIERHRREPFLLVIAFAEPHSPYNGPFNNEHLFGEVELDPAASIPLGDGVPLRYRLMQEWQQGEALLDRKRRSNLFFFGITPDECRGIKQRYWGLVTLIDQAIGAILDYVERVGLRDDTMIVHTSDHGDMMGSHQLFAKEVMFEGAVRVPYLIRLPNERRCKIVDQAVSHIDFIPTLIDLLGQAPMPQCSGVSRLPLLRGEVMTPENVFIEWSPNRTKIKKKTSLAPRRMIKRAINESTRTVISPDGWKLSLRDKDLNELYNLDDDPGETRNLYSDPRYAAIISRYTDEVHRWQERVNDGLRL